MERQDSGLASIKSVVALRDFDAAFDRFGSSSDYALKCPMSAFTSCGHAAYPALVRVVPLPDQSMCSIYMDIPSYSMTSSASASSFGVMGNPSALTVLRLITNSTLVGCRTGRSVRTFVQHFVRLWAYFAGGGVPPEPLVSLDQKPITISAVCGLVTNSMKQCPNICNKPYAI
jgi:hypothetical protein